MRRHVGLKPSIPMLFLFLTAPVFFTIIVHTLER